MGRSFGAWRTGWRTPAPFSGACLHECPLRVGLSLIDGSRPPRHPAAMSLYQVLQQRGAALRRDEVRPPCPPHARAPAHATLHRPHCHARRTRAVVATSTCACACAQRGIPLRDLFGSRSAEGVRRSSARGHYAGSCLRRARCGTALRGAQVPFPLPPSSSLLCSPAVSCSARACRQVWSILTEVISEIRHASKPELASFNITPDSLCTVRRQVLPAMPPNIGCPRPSSSRLARACAAAHPYFCGLGGGTSCVVKRRRAVASGSWAWVQAPLPTC